MGPVAERLRDKLQRGFEPERLDIVDDSARHAGHRAARPEGESHFSVTIVSPAFQGLSRVERQRRVYAALAEELSGPVHALSVKALAPGEG
jgi:BolA protein